MEFGGILFLKERKKERKTTFFRRTGIDEDRMIRGVTVIRDIRLRGSGMVSENFCGPSPIVLFFYFYHDLFGCPGRYHHLSSHVFVLFCALETRILRISA